MRPVRLNQNSSVVGHETMNSKTPSSSAQLRVKAELGDKSLRNLSQGNFALIFNRKILVIEA